MKCSGLAQEKVLSQNTSVTTIALMEQFETVNDLAYIDIDELTAFIAKSGREKFADPAATAKAVQTAARGSYRLPKTILLRETARILKESFCDGGRSLVARIGGDEYSILLPNALPSDVQSAIQRIQDAITDYNSGSRPVLLGLSLGYASRESSFGNTDALFKEADDNMYREKLHHRKSIRSDLVQTLLQTLEAKNVNTMSHCKRLQEMVSEFSGYMGLSQSRTSDLQLFARFHDIGKVGIPDHILFKQGKLTPQERTEMQWHCQIGYRIAHSSADLLPVADWILKHHEWWNGKGYP